MLSNNLKNIRSFLGKTQEEMANSLYISRPAYAAKEEGRAGITTTQALRLIEVIKTEKRRNLSIHQLVNSKVQLAK